MNKTISQQLERIAFDAGIVSCPECGCNGPHDDNGERSFEHRSYACAECGTHFDAAELWEHGVE